MYKVEPHTGNLVAEPELNFYKIEPIHEHLRSSASPSASTNSPKKEEKSAGDINSNEQSLKDKENHLIDALTKFNTKVDKAIEEFGGNKGGKQAKKTNEKPAKTDDKKPAKAEDKKPAKEDKKPAKEDKKQAKKDEKKAKKEENKASNTPQKTEKPKPEATASPSDLPALTVPERQSPAKPVAQSPAKPVAQSSAKPVAQSPAKSAAQSTAQANGSETALDPFDYQSKDLPEKFNATLQYCAADSKWVEVLKTLAQKRGGLEIGEKASGERSIQLELVEQGNVQLVSSIFCIPVRGRLAVWKVIGAMLGIFDFTDASLVGGNHVWLCQAEDTLKGRRKLDDLSREACQRLGPHDFLVTDSPSLADYIVCSLLSEASYAPNNVELWIKRIQN